MRTDIKLKIKNRDSMINKLITNKIPEDLLDYLSFIS